MIFDFLLKRIRFAQKGDLSTSPSTLKQIDEESSDFGDPFGEPVVIEFRDVLDLHSIPPNQTRAVVEDYIQEANRRGVRWVRIIHGKGIGVQREIVRSILASSSEVVDYRDAPGDAGGWGATVVTLIENKES